MEKPTTIRQADQARALWLSTIAFTVCFAVWTIFAIIGAWGLEKMFIEPSGLPAEEKQAGKRTLERVMRGLMEKKISEQAFQQALPRQAQPGQPPPHNDRLTDQEVRDMLADMKKLADDAGIPDEGFSIDVGDEVKKVVDKALAGKNVP